MNEVFGAVLSLKDNVSGVLKAASKESKSFGSEVKKARERLEALDKQKLKEKEMKFKTSKANKAIKDIKKQLKPLRNKAIEIKAKTDHALGKIKKLKDHLGKVKDKKEIEFKAKGVGAVAKAVGTLALGGMVAGFGLFSAGAGIAIKSAIDFQSQMANVGTLLDGDVNAKLRTMGDELKQVSMDTGISTENLSSGLYEVVSAFGESKDSMQQLTIAAKAAKAGNAETADSVRMLSAVTKGYGDTSADAVQKAADLAFETVKLGQTSFSELASSMGSVVPIASAMKVSQEELFGAMATLTGVTGGTAEVSTQLKATMQGFMTPTKEMSDALKKMGYSSGAAALESESLGSILTKLKDSVNGDTVAFANMFSSVEAKNAVLALAGTQAENFATKTEAMKNAAGASDEAFKRQTSSVKEMANNIRNKGMVMLMGLGEKALPVVSKVLDQVSANMPLFSNALNLVVEKVSPLLSSLSMMFLNLTSDMDLTPAIGLISTNIDTFMGLINQAMPTIQAIFFGIGSVISSIMPICQEIFAGISAKWQGLVAVLNAHSGTIQQVFAILGPAISEVLGTLWTVVGPVFDLIIAGVDLLLAAFEKAFPTIQAVVETAWGIIKPIIEAIGTGVSLVADVVSAVSSALGGGSAKGGSVPAHATGTSYFSGGLTTVGEHGTELVELPAGSKIHSHSQTKAMQGAREVNIHIANMTVREEADIEKIAKKLVEELKKVDR